MNILLMLPSLDAGGAENYALRLVQYGGSPECRWTVMYPQHGFGDLHSDFIEAGARMKEMRLGFLSVSALASFRRYLATEEFDGVCSFNGVFAGPAVAMARLARIPVRVVWHRRSTPAYRPSLGRGIYARLAASLVELCATRILSNSAAALDAFHGQGWPTDNRFSVIPNGVDAERFRPDAADKADARARLSLPRDGLIIGHVGRFDPAKNHQTIFKVILAMARLNPEFKFLFCGKGTDSLEFLERLRRHEIENYCITLGLQRDLPLVYRSLDAFYFPSWTEGQPNALIEAMLSGVPFVASDIPGIRASVPPWAADRLVAPDDVESAVRQLSDAMNRRAVDLQAVRDWARETFDLETNLSRALSAMVPVPLSAGRHA